MNPKHIILTLLIMLCPIGMAAQSTITRNKPKPAVTKPKPAAKPKARPKAKPKPTPRRNSTSHPNNTSHSSSTSSTTSVSAEQNTTPHSSRTSSTGNLSTEQVTTPHSNSTSNTGNLSTERVTTPHSDNTSSTAALIAELNKLINNMVYVSGGTFTMGEKGRKAYDDEKPTHSVTLSSYYICKYEVTQALWRAVMDSNPSGFKGDNLPVENVNWDDCQTFINRLNNYTGRNFRLPTEAEWEFAARGGNNSRHYKYSGSNYIGDVAWYDGNSGNRTHPVGTKQTNELGLYDMSGNVWEWCSDWYGSYSSYSQTNPTGPNSGSYRVLRGGSWDFIAWCCRASDRLYGVPGGSDGDNNLGLRLVLSQL